MNQDRRLEEVRRVTAFFSYWQGLRLVPLGFMLMVEGLLLSPLFEGKGLGVGVILLAVVVATVMFSCVIAAGYYRSAYGVVRNPATNRRLDAWLVLFIPLLALLLVLDARLELPVFVSGLVWAGAAWLYERATGGGRRHWRLLALALVLLTPLPLLGVSPDWMTSLFLGVLGLGYAACGMLDHLEFTRILPPVKDDDGTAL